MDYKDRKKKMEEQRKKDNNNIKRWYNIGKVKSYAEYKKIKEENEEMERKRKEMEERFKGKVLSLDSARRNKEKKEKEISD